MTHAGSWLARRIAPWMLFSLTLAAPLHAATLDPAVLPKVQAATFEVVIPKPVNDTLTYEKPLPLDELPFQFRNDKYFSIGTAFALGDHRYATAAHVLDVGLAGLNGEPALRDASGKVYAIDKVVKFSREQDFVVFSLKNDPNVTALGTDTSPAMNDVVYAVGNALGTGVVIRDGLYTSNTPEDQDGRWNWIRFSAAASPGNSGGPLLDKDGKIIGIVLMKSPGENLNYALPIDRILKAPDNLAEADTRMSYQLDVLDTSRSSHFKTQFALPLSFADFSKTYLARSDAWSDQQLQGLLKDNQDNLFPTSKGSNAVLHGGTDMDSFPTLIVRGENGVWGMAHRGAHKETLDHNGFVASNVIGQEAMVHLRRPDDVDADAFYRDPKLAMDLVLKGLPFHRPIGSQKIKITSLGKPTEDSRYTDAYQRHWQVRVWPLAYQDKLLIVFALPVPDGYVMMARTSAPAGLHDDMLDLHTLCNFFDVAYGGTLAQWHDFLKLGALLPGPLEHTRIDLDYAHRFAYHSPRVSFDFTPDLQKIERDSELQLGFTYFNDHGKVAWDVTEVFVGAKNGEKESVRVVRHSAPSEDLDNNYQSHWNKLVQRQHPNDDVAYSENDATIIRMVSGTPDKAPAAAEPDVLYTAAYVTEGTRSQDAMKAKLDLLAKDLKVEER